jgi:hypothetical protein
MRGLRWILSGIVGLIAFGSAAFGEFMLKDDGKALTVVENGQPVLSYNYGWVDPPEGIDKRFRRSCYIHPLWGAHGEQFTEDFPKHHAHQRGVFWAWPEATLGSRRVDTWGLEGTRQHFVEWTDKQASKDFAIIGAKNVWKFDGEETPFVEERITVTAFSPGKNGRMVEFSLQLKNLAHDILTLRGAKGKGYGGFGVCPDTHRAPFVFTTKDGLLDVKEGVLRYAAPWADIGLAPDINGETSGVAVFQDPRNPGYPHDGWMFRPYGYLGAAWPHEAGFEVKSGESVTLRYGLFVHSGSATDAQVAEEFAKFTDPARISPPNR